jgi:uncharacterized phage protein gp47/JayE
MPLPLQTFDQLVQNQAAAILSSSDQLTDFSEGSILRSVVESNAGNSIWIQGLISALLAVARLQTSSDNDVDTFVNQFGYSRSGAVAASGNVTFGRSITTTPSSIPASTTRVQTSINQTVFQTTVDTANPAYDPSTDSYIMDIGVSSLTVPVTCLTAGSVGNIQVGAIDTIVSALINVNTVTNSAAYTNGSDKASDPVTKQDFVLYLAGLSRATNPAIASAVASVPEVTRSKIVGLENESGDEQLGYFYVVIDNGLGTISADIRDKVYAAVYAYHGLAIQFNVDRATQKTLSSITVQAIVDAATFASTPAKNAITASIKQNIVNFLATLEIGTTFYISRIAQIVYDSSEHVIDAYDIEIDSASVDIPGEPLKVITIDPTLIAITYHAPP